MKDSIPRDGGLAFPGSRMERLTPITGGETQAVEADYPGMTLRDWFAGQALHGLPMRGGSAEDGWGWAAARAYAIADAMLLERDKP